VVAAPGIVSARAARTSGRADGGPPAPLPLGLWEQSQEHVDELLREFTLITEGEDEHPSVPRRLLDPIAELTATYANFSSPTEQERDDAIARGEAEIDLVYRVPAGASVAIRHLGDMLDEADAYCRQGSHLLTLQTPPDQRAFRTWFLAEFLSQLAGAADPLARVHRRGLTRSSHDEPGSLSVNSALNDQFNQFPRATKYFALGWWQMMAEVVCSGTYWKSSLTATPMRSASRRSATLRLSSKSGQAG